LIQSELKAEEPHVRALAALLVEACSLHPLEICAIEKIGILVKAIIGDFIFDQYLNS